MSFVKHFWNSRSICYHSNVNDGKCKIVMSIKLTFKTLSLTLDINKPENFPTEFHLWPDVNIKCRFLLLSQVPSCNHWHSEPSQETETWGLLCDPGHFLPRTPLTITPGMNIQKKIINGDLIFILLWMSSLSLHVSQSYTSWLNSKSLLKFYAEPSILFKVQTSDHVTRYNVW